ncbi:hypothetical protein FB45DRAFT_1038738 [Roridomyces roridus]|uniref:CxC1-like cysteine cluster associated with KDZ transposases domain-containing protein n=1 Tax=Roridomyces roridus TaxID=1738132 RepID=A0AAD7B474_9AGAR|nr:hypothetical protein FB45DRAFT_1038738 [Roridomyces roridus]
MSGRNGGVKQSHASSAKLNILGSRRTVPGQAPRFHNRTLGPQAIDNLRSQRSDEMREQLTGMDGEQRANLDDLRRRALDDNYSPPALTSTLEQDVLDGSERLNLSHAGGELNLPGEGVFLGLEEDLTHEVRSQSKRYDWRTRTDQTERRNQAFQSQMEGLTDAYMRFCAEDELRGRHGGNRWEELELRRQTRAGDSPTVEAVYEIKVVDSFETRTVDVDVSDTQGRLNIANLVVAGLMPCAPYTPHVAFTIRVLESYRTLHARCPQLAIHAYVKALCDQHEVEYYPYLRQQFSNAYDVYLEIRHCTDARRLKHACPACTYKLEGEDDLIFDMLTTMDGNDSLKRVLRRSKVEQDNESSEPTLGPSRERVDNRDAGDGYFIDRGMVEEWAKRRLADILPMEANSDEDNPCADRWKNMINDVTSKMWGIFDETGIFLALCRHGFVLVIADMIRSGELAKYPLAVVKLLLDTFGFKLGAGYDVGCHFGTTVNNSDLGEQARAQGFKSLVGSFHGHAHNRLCQLNFLATYVKGLGIEDLEGCERFFSRSNGLAKSCRYASRFHRQQEISTYCKQIDAVETYANLSNFLCTNYRQALNILKTEPALHAWMEREGIEDVETFHEWLREEREYLLGLKAASRKDVETLEMEYIRKLRKLQDSTAKHATLLGLARQANRDDGDFVPGVRKEDVARRHAKDRVDRDREAVRELERLLEVSQTWTESSPKWSETVVAIQRRDYQAALNALELVVVERIFELTKVNRSQTGYKMRTHIGKALQARSKAVRNAIERYNAAARELTPPKPDLTWNQVVEYAFLGDFDLLRDAEAVVLSRPWTRPAYRMYMDNYFKTLRAREEIKRLNVEIPRVITWIQDETRVLEKKEEALERAEDGTDEEQRRSWHLAVQVRLYRQRRGRFNAGHMARFRKLAGTPGFTGSIRPGRAVEVTESRRAQRAADGELLSRVNGDSEDEMEGVEETPAAADAPPTGEDGVDDDEEGEDAHDEEVGELLYHISRIGLDDGDRPRADDDG